MNIALQTALPAKSKIYKTSLTLKCVSYLSVPCLRTYCDLQLFFLDSGAPASQSKSLATSSHDEAADETSKHGEVPAWVDSDDERVTVSLASDSRLRKLRLTEHEDLVDGRTYVRRLQQQYERLHPRPEWARMVPSKEQHRKKRRRLSESSSSTDAETTETTETAPASLEELSAKPLDQLLRSTAPMIKQKHARSGPLKLRPGAIDIQRSRDLGAVQSVKCCPPPASLITNLTNNLPSLQSQLSPSTPRTPSSSPPPPPRPSSPPTTSRPHPTRPTPPSTPSPSPTTPSPPSLSPPPAPPPCSPRAPAPTSSPGRSPPAPSRGPPCRPARTSTPRTSASRSRPAAATSRSPARRARAAPAKAAAAARRARAR